MPNKIDSRRKSALIIECTSEDLRKKSMSLGDDILTIFKSCFPKNPINLVETSTETQLLKDLGELSSNNRRFKNIIIIGHSNEDGLQITSDVFAKWDVMGNWLEPFKPEKIFLIACRGGRWLPCAFLFEKIKSLKEIYGSPLPLNKKQAYCLPLAVMYALGAKKIDSETMTLGQLANFIFTKGIIFKQTREDYKESNLVDGLLWTIAESAIEEFMDSGIKLIN